MWWILHFSGSNFNRRTKQQSAWTGTKRWRGEGDLDVLHKEAAAAVRSARHMARDGPQALPYPAASFPSLSLSLPPFSPFLIIHPYPLFPLSSSNFPISDQIFIIPMAFFKLYPLWINLICGAALHKIDPFPSCAPSSFLAYIYFLFDRRFDRSAHNFFRFFSSSFLLRFCFVSISPQFLVSIFISPRFQSTAFSAISAAQISSAEREEEKELLRDSSKLTHYPSVKSSSFQKFLHYFSIELPLS